MSKDNADDKSKGVFKPPDSTFRNFIQKGGKYEAAKDRYHLYVSYACPFATRTILTHQLKGLKDIVPMTIVSPRIDELGWAFKPADPYGYAGTEADPLYNSNHLRDVYHIAAPNFEGPYTVPLLWDKQTKTIVNNESSEVVRILNSAFNELIDDEQYRNLDLYPENLQKEIDGANEWVMDTLNKGVYKAGFAKDQAAYDAAIKAMFASIDKLEKMLDGKDYIIGNTLTETDVHAYVTLIRFDPVYAGLFKCNQGMIRHDYPNIHLWMRKLYWNNAGFKSSTNFEHIKIMYYTSGSSILNPFKIVPVGPVPPIKPL